MLQEVAAAGPQGLPVNEALARAETTRSTLRRAEQESLLKRVPHEDGERVVSAVAADALEDRLIALRQAERPLRALRLLARADAPVALTELRTETSVTRDQLERLEELGLIHLGETESWYNARIARDFVPDSAPPLTPGQQTVWQEIEAELRRWPQVSEAARRRFLLHGVTGSGKTEIYLRAIELTLAQGRQALFLVPEIALTAQTLRRVAARFPGQVAVSHSGLGDGERHHLWRRARAGEIKVVVGTRSALYTPLPDVGLVVLDEEHDASYRQGTDAAIPYYHARSVAGEMMRANNGVLLLGSATPDVETYYHAQRGDLRLLQLPQRIMGHRRRIRQLADERGLEARYVPAPAGLALMIELASVQLVDMRSELRTGNTGIFSRKLLAALARGAGQPAAGAALPEPARRQHLGLLPRLRPRGALPALRQRAHLAPPRWPPALPPVQPRAGGATQLSRVSFSPHPLLRRRHPAGRAGVAAPLPARARPALGCRQRPQRQRP